MSLNEAIPAAWRKPTYVIYALIGVALGAIATAYGPDNIPEWHAVTTNVVLYIGGAFGLTAAANTIVSRSADSEGDEEIDPDDDDDVPLDEDSEYNDDDFANAEVDSTPVPEDFTPRH